MRKFAECRLLAAILLSLFATFPLRGAATVQDLAGSRIPALPPAETRAQVFLFISTDCPISNSYAPEYRRLAADFGEKQFLFRLVYPNADDTPDLIKAHLKDYNLPVAAWRDPEHQLVREAKVRVTPEAAVYLPGQGWIYRGRIDDRYADFGKARPEAVVHDLRDILEKIRRGEKIKFTETRAVGCYISEHSPNE